MTKVYTPDQTTTDWDIEVSLYGGEFSLNAYRLAWQEQTVTDFQFDAGEWYLVKAYGDENERKCVLRPVDFATLGLGDVVDDWLSATDDDRDLIDYSSWTTKSGFSADYPHTTEVIRKFLESLEPYPSIINA